MTRRGIGAALVGLASLLLWPTAPQVAAATAPADAGGPPPARAVSGYSVSGADTCLGCHATPNILGLFRTKHAKANDPRSPFGHDGLQCEACHGPGAAHANAGDGMAHGLIQFGAKGSPPLEQNAACLGCHQSNAAHEWASSAHAANNVVCADCHKSHVPKDPIMQAATQVDACTTCHQVQGTNLLKASHHPLREGTMTCTSCHSPHGSTATASLVKNTVNETCTTCHAEFRGPYRWEHQPVTEDCGNCHEPHGSAQPALLTLPAPFLCQSCHQAAGHPSAALTPRALAGGSAPNPSLLGRGCVNCHSQVHGSNHPSGRALMR